MNYKNIDFTTWGGLDGFLKATSNGNGITTRASLLKSVVPWLAKAHNLTKNAVANLPFDIVNEKGEVIDTSTDWGNEIGGLPNPKRTMSLLAGSLCGGTAYLLPDRTPRRLINLQYVAPHTITPYIDRDGLQYFDRATDKGVTEHLQPNELIYFWLPDSDVEIGAPLSSPMSAALMASELLASMSTTMKIYGDRGFVPAYLGNYEGVLDPAEKKRTEMWLNQFLRGAYNGVVKLINSTRFELVRVGAGMEELKGAYSEIQRQAIEDIGAAHGIPAALFMSDKAFASEVNPLIKEWYSSSEFISIYQTIEETFNTQILAPWGYRLQYKPESLSVFQEDENARASAVSSYTSAIKDDPEIAKFVMSFLGVDLDEEQEAKLKEIINSRVAEEETTTPEAMPEATPEDNAPEMEPLSLAADETKDLALWFSKAKEWHKKGKGGAVEWECKHLREEIAAPIRLKLAEATTELDIVKAFEIGKTAQNTTPDTSAIKALADSINRLAEPQRKEEGMNIIIDTQGNHIKTAQDGNAQILEAIKALVLQNSIKADIVIPAPLVTVNMPEQPAPIVNVPVTVSPSTPAVNNITVKPADVILPPVPTEATITTDRNGKKTLKVK